MLGLGKEVKGFFFIQYLLYTHVLILYIKVSKLFRKIICGVMHHKSYGLVLTAAIEVRKHVPYILDNIIIFPLQWFYDILGVILSFQIL